MLFRLKTPSISAIRAQFILERLQSLNSTNNITISLCATGRTGSGKTTLGNRLVGIDYFMPSTGNQDCTDEINLIAFPSGIKYFDTPGVGSDEALENYNRAALGIKQLDFPLIQNLTLTRYSQQGTEKTVNKQYFGVAGFREQLHPDLIFYMVAVHQQFLNVDCIYLKDLLTCYPRQVIYVLNIFADKETGTISYGTEQNVIDIVKKIKKVHHYVLGNEQQPFIIPVNCWTGEGISKLLIKCYEILGTEKGKLFEELIQYQQQKTPDEYVNQVQRELLKLFAHAACQKPEGTYTCDQFLHKGCYSLLNFMSELQVKSQQYSYHLNSKIYNLIQEVLDLPLQPTEQPSNSFFDDVECINNALIQIQEGLYSLNEKINYQLNPSKQEALQFRYRELEKINQKIVNQSEIINSLESELNHDFEVWQSIRSEIQAINYHIESRIDRYTSLVEDYKSFNETLNIQIDSFNSKVESLQLLTVQLGQRLDNYNSRRTRLDTRITSLNLSIDKIKTNPYARVPQSTIDILKAEKDSIDIESSYLESEEISLKQANVQRDAKISNIEEEEELLRFQVSERDKLREQIEREYNLIQEIKKQGISKINLFQNRENQIQFRLKDRSNKRKIIEDNIMYCKAIINLFEQDFAQIEEQVDTRINSINSRLEIINLHILLRQETDVISSQALQSLQQEINHCLQEIRQFNNEINCCKYEIQICQLKLIINQLIMELLVECTIHHFNEVDFCEYKGSTYNYFGRKAITSLLTIAHLIITEKLTSIEYEYLQEVFKKLIDNINEFPNQEELRESRVFSVLEPKIDYLFSSDFVENLKKIAM